MTVKKSNSKPAIKKVAIKSAVKKVAVKKVALKKSAVKKVAVKKAAVKKVALKKAANKKEVNTKVVKETAKKSRSVLTKKKKSDDTTIVFDVNAIALKSLDYSGATIIEWFDSGLEEDNLACPDNYSKVKNGFWVYWDRAIDNNISSDLLDDAIRQIRYWANEYDASFNAGSSITIEDSDGNKLKKYSFDIDSWA